jgi:glyoxylase I family protein
MTGLSHVQLSVSDVAASAEWYTAALGLESYAADPDVGYVALRHRAARVVIVLTARARAEPPTGIAVPAGERAPQPAGGSLDHLAFAVPDGDALDEWAGHLTRIGIDHPGVVPENGNPSLQLRDPDGITIELVAPRPPSPHRPPDTPAATGQTVAR